MAILPPSPYSTTLLEASRLATESYLAVHRKLYIFYHAQPPHILQLTGPGCSAMIPNPQLEAARCILQTLTERYRVFRDCIEQALSFPNPSVCQSEVYQLLQLNQFYPDAISNEPNSPDSIGKEIAVAVRAAAAQESLAQQAHWAVPTITDAARIRLTALALT